MIFISRFTNYKLGLRPTIKQSLNDNTGSPMVIQHRGVTVEFQKAVFDTADWRKYSRPESPDNINAIKSEDDLVKLMMTNPYYGTDFFARVEETVADRKSRLLKQLAELEAEEVSGGGKLDHPNATIVGAPMGSVSGTAPSKSESRRKAASKAPSKSPRRSSRVEV